MSEPPISCLEDLRRAQGLSDEAVILAASALPVNPPMQMPLDAWGLVVDAADVVGEDVELLAGRWVGEEHDAGSHSGDVVIHLAVVSPSMVDVHMSLAWQGQWRAGGLWPGLTFAWPRVVAPTAALVMELAQDA